MDADPALHGLDAGTAAGLPTQLGVRIAPDWPASAADVAVICTTSRLADLSPLVATAFDRGLDVVSTCEPLAGPAPDDLDATALDVLALRAGRRLIGVGVNPGFLLDLLPLVLSGTQSDLRAVHVRRVVDLATRRPQLAAKVGVGLTRAEFQSATAHGAIGHVGLGASARLLAAGLDWAIDTIRETIQPVVGSDGRCRGARQGLRGMARGELRITLGLTIAERPRASGDTIWLDGTPPLRWAVRPAVPGDEATAALVVNALFAVRDLPPGLRTVVDLAPLRYRSRAPPASQPGR